MLSCMHMAMSNTPKQNPESLSTAYSVFPILWLKRRNTSMVGRSKGRSNSTSKKIKLGDSAWEIAGTKPRPVAWSILATLDSKWLRLYIANCTRHPGNLTVNCFQDSNAGILKQRHRWNAEISDLTYFYGPSLLVPFVFKLRATLRVTHSLGDYCRGNTPGYPKDGLILSY